jgi:hypothetical protein
MIRVEHVAGIAGKRDVYGFLVGKPEEEGL